VPQAAAAAAGQAAAAVAQRGGAAAMETISCVAKSRRKRPKAAVDQ